MELFETVLLIFLMLVAVAMCGLILIQQSKGSDIGAAFGSGAASTVFGSSGATPFLVKVTAMLAVSFFLVTFGLAYVAAEKVGKDQAYDFGDLPVSSEGADSAESVPEPAGPDVPVEGDELPITEEGDSLPPINTDDSTGDDLPENPDI